MAFQQADHNHGKENDMKFFSTIELYKYDIMTYKRYKQNKKIHSQAMKAVFETYKRNVNTASTDSVDKKEPSQRDKCLYSYTLRQHDPRAHPLLCNYNVQLPLRGEFFFLLDFKLFGERGKKKKREQYKYKYYTYSHYHSKLLKPERFLFSVIICIYMAKLVHIYYGQEA